MKHKEVQRWAAGTDLWDDQIIVVKATLVQTANQYRLKKTKEGHLGSTESQFSACIGYRQPFDIDIYPDGPGYATRDGALRGYLKHLREKVEEAEKTLAARKRDVSRMVAQMKNQSFKVCQ